MCRRSRFSGRKAYSASALEGYISIIAYIVHGRSSPRPPECLDEAPGLDRIHLDERGSAAGDCRIADE